MKRLLVPLCLLLIASPGFADGAQQAPFLWKVQNESTTHYLMGSVHMLPAAAYPLPAELLEAYEQTQGLVLEADIQDLTSPGIQAMMLNGARTTRPGGIKKIIGEKLYATLQARAAELGAPGPLCDPFKAWFCALTLELFSLQGAGFAPELGIDHYFHTKAREDGRVVRGLETAEEQVGMFVNLSQEESISMLAATLEEVTSTSQDPQRLFEMWRDNDIAAVERLIREMKKKYPAFHKRLLIDRNRAWMPRLQGILGSEVPHLVIVGAAHMPAEGGLLDLLAEAGFKAVAVPRKAPPVEAAEVAEPEAPGVPEASDGPEPAEPADEEAVEAE